MDQIDSDYRINQLAKLVKLAVFGQHPISLSEEAKFVSFLNSLNPQQIDYYATIGLIQNRQSSQRRADESDESIS